MRGCCTVNTYGLLSDIVGLGSGVVRREIYSSRVVVCEAAKDSIVATVAWISSVLWLCLVRPRILLLMVHFKDQSQCWRRQYLQRT